MFIDIQGFDHLAREYDTLILGLAGDWVNLELGENHSTHGMHLISSTGGAYMNNTFIMTVSTRMFTGDDPILTTLTVDTSKLSEQQIREYAAAKAVVPWQSLVRSKKSIPRTATYVIAPVGARGVQTIDHYAALVKAVGSNVADAAVDKFGSAEKACNELASLLGSKLTEPESDEPNYIVEK